MKESDSPLYSNILDIVNNYPTKLEFYCFGCCAELSKIMWVRGASRVLKRYNLIYEHDFPNITSIKGLQKAVQSHWRFSRESIQVFVSAAYTTLRSRKGKNKFGYLIRLGNRTLVQNEQVLSTPDLYEYMSEIEKDALRIQQDLYVTDYILRELWRVVQYL